MNFQIEILVNSQFYLKKIPNFLLLKIHNLTKPGYMNEETANYIEVKQGGRHLLDSNQFEYRVTKKKPNKTYYQCIQRKNNSCPAGAVVNNENDKIISFLGEHSHDST